MKINRKLNKEKWCKFGGKVEFLLRVFPFSELIGVDKIGKTMADQFAYCVTDWKNILDEDNKPLVCNEENKLYLYDYYEDVRNFVFEELKKLNDDKSKERKN